MAHRIFYEIDGRVGGPVSFVQLQMMATSGMLQEHHRVRLEDTDAWVLAKQVRNLFDTPAPVPVGRAVPAAVAADSWNSDQPTENPGVNSAFDFFSDAEPAPPPPDPPKKKAKGRTAQSKAPEPSPFVGESPDDMPVETERPPSGEFGVATPADESLNDAESQSPANAPTVTTKVPPTESPDVQANSKPEAKNPPAAEEVPNPVLAEVIGQAVDLIGADAARLQDGRMTFRLYSDWLLATTKFNDGTTRNAFLRLGQIDSAVLEQRPPTRRNKGGPFPVLSFTAGLAMVALAFQGSEKPYRAFLEKVLQRGSSAKKESN